MPTREKTPEQQARMTKDQRDRYVERRQADMKAEAAANGGTCVANECDDKVDESGFLCRKHRLQFAGWNYALPDHQRQWEFYFSVR